jgi:hypothetical protein
LRAARFLRRSPPDSYSAEVPRIACFGYSSKELAMANQEESKDAAPHKDGNRASPDVEQETRGDGPGKVGLTSDQQPGLVSPSGVNQRDHGAADDKPMGGGSVDFDDDDMVHPRGKTTSTGGTWKAEGADSAPLGSPNAGLSDRNAPSDPDNKKQ